MSKRESRVSCYRFLLTANGRVTDLIPTADQLTVLIRIAMSQRRSAVDMTAHCLSACEWLSCIRPVLEGASKDSATEIYLVRLFRLDLDELLLVECLR